MRAGEACQLGMPVLERREPRRQVGQRAAAMGEKSI